MVVLVLVSGGVVAADRANSVTSEAVQVNRAVIEFNINKTTFNCRRLQHTVTNKITRRKMISVCK